MAGQLNKYKATVNGAETTLMLTDDDAQSRGLTKDNTAGEKQAPPPANKARTAPNKSGAN